MGTQLHTAAVPPMQGAAAILVSQSTSASAGSFVSRNPANQGQNSSVSTFRWPFVLILILKPSEVKSPLYINTWYKMAEQCLEPFHKLLKIVP